MPGNYDSNGDGYHLNDRGDCVAALTWYCVLTVPYTTLKSAPPKRGSRWLLNIARTDYFSPKSEPELSLWSPNLENMTFHDPECFGTAVFK